MSYMEKPEYLREKRRCEKIAAHNPNRKPDGYLCLIPEDPSFETPWGKGKEEMYGVFSDAVRGYEKASERTPYFVKRDRAKSSAS